MITPLELFKYYTHCVSHGIRCRFKNICNDWFTILNVKIKTTKTGNTIDQIVATIYNGIDQIDYTWTQSQINEAQPYSIEFGDIDNFISTAVKRFEIYSQHYIQNLTKEQYLRYLNGWDPDSPMGKLKDFINKLNDLYASKSKEAESKCSN